MANLVGFDNTSNVRDMVRNQRARISGLGDELLQRDQDQIADETRRRYRYTDPLDQMYEQDAAGGGGYSPEEIRRIYGDQGLADLQLTDAERAEAFLTPEEQAGARGDTGTYNRYFDPDRMDQDLRTAQGRQFQAVDDLDQSLRTSVDPGRLRQSETFQQNARNILSQNRGGFDATHGAVSGNVRGAIDPGAVTTSDAFLEDYQMSPEEKQRIVTGAGISAGTGYRAAIGEAERRSRAAGIGPMGVAALRNRLEREAAASAGDAMTQARIRADEADAQRKLTGEQLRTQGGRYLTDVRTGTEMNLGQEALRGQENLGQQALAQENLLEQNRQGTEQFVTDANLDVARTAGNARLQNAQNVAATGQGAREFSTTAGTGIAMAQDRDAAAREAELAANRQAASRYGQDQRYSRGMAANTATSNRAATVGDTRLGQQQRARDYFSGQGTQANQNAEAARQRQQSSYATQTGGTNDATRTGMQADQAPKLWEKIAGTAIGAVGALSGAGILPKKADGGVVMEPTVALVGEEGPEMIVPLGKRDRPQVRPGMAKRYYGQAA